MGSLTFDALQRSVKKGVLDPVYYLHGDEDVLKDEAIRALRDAALDRAARDFNLDQRSVSTLDAGALHTLVNTPPLLADRRLVVLRDVADLRRKPKVREELLRYLDNPSPGTILVMVNAAADEPDDDLTSRSSSVACDRLPPERVARWAAYHAGTLGIELSPEAAELLVLVAGDDLGVLGKEIEKLSGIGAGGAGGAGGAPVSRETVAALVGVRHGETVYDLVDAILDRQPARAAGLVSPVLEIGGMSGVRILGTLGTMLVATALARAELNAGASPARLVDIMYRHLQSARPFGLRSWRAEAGRLARWAQSWTPRELTRALLLAREADRALKNTTATDDRGIVTQLVLTLGTSVSEAA